MVAAAAFVCVCVFVCACLSKRVRACVCACLRACVRERVRVCVREKERVYACVSKRVCVRGSHPSINHSGACKGRARARGALSVSFDCLSYKTLRVVESDGLCTIYV